MTSRFPAQKVKESEGSRGPSGKRLSISSSVGSLPSVGRGPLFGSLSKRSTVDGSFARTGSKQGARHITDVVEPSQDELKKAHGMLCYTCGAATVQTGLGMRQCPECHSIQLQSGGMSHAFASKMQAVVGEASSSSRAGSKLSVAPDANASPGSRSASKRGVDAGSRAGSKQGARTVSVEAAPMEVSMDDGGVGGALNPMGARSAWKRMSVHAHQDMANALSGQVDESERTPIMAGFVDTGYCVGDKVKTTLRLPSSGGSVGWDPLAETTNTGVVTGPGIKPGEIMVQFNGVAKAASMKMTHIKLIADSGPMTNVDRSRCRKTTMVRFHTTQ